MSPSRGQYKKNKKKTEKERKKEREKARERKKERERERARERKKERQKERRKERQKHRNKERRKERERERESVLAKNEGRKEVPFRSVLVVPWLGPSLFGSFCSRGSVARSLAVRFSTFRTFSNLSYLLQPFIPPPTFHTLVAPSGEGRRSASSGCFTVSERPSQGGAGALGAWPVVSGALRVEGQRL